MAKKPYLSVVVPAYNEEALIGKCLDSLSKQSLDSSFYEIIVIDNASTDKTAQIANRSGIEVLKERRKSVVLARQKGVSAAKGEVIVSADADTVYPPGWLERIKRNFDKDTSLIALAGWIYFKNTSTFYNLSFAFSQEVNLWLSRLTGKFPQVYAANFAFKKSALDEIGGYPAHIPELGDQQYLLYKFFKLGKVKIDKRLSCHTSARRHKQKVKNLVVYNGWYRIAGYLVNRLLRRELIGPAPAIRTTPSQKSRSGK